MYGGQTQGTETSYYLEEEKEKSISLVAASEKERAQTGGHVLRGCGEPITKKESSGTQLESWTIGGNSPVREREDLQGSTRVPRDT